MGIVRDALGESRAVFLVLITIIVVLGLMPIHTIIRNIGSPLAKKKTIIKTRFIVSKNLAKIMIILNRRTK
ncbi:MAG: hypothetical protein QXN02_06695 [Ignisphaera sp.]